MGEKRNKNSEVYNHYLELSKPTAEDFQRVFSDGELKELCLKHKCRVDMWRWNVVADYRRCFTETGRYQRWSERDRLRMLAKAVNRMKPSVLYNDEEIQECRREEWGLQLKENILSLNFWKRQRLHRNEVLTESVEDERQVIESQNGSVNEELQIEELITEEIPLGFEVHTESANASNLIIQTQRVQEETHNEGDNDNDADDEVEIFDYIDNADEYLIVEEDSEDIELEVEKQFQTESLGDKLITHNYILQAESESDDEDDSQDSILTVANKEARELQSEEIAPEIENIYGINTLSMTMDSQMATQSTQSLPIEQSQDVIPHNYDNFKNIIPLTSTQSQNFESQENVET